MSESLPLFSASFSPPAPQRGVVLCAQESVSYEFNAAGDLILEQTGDGRAGPGGVLVAASYVDSFISELLAARRRTAPVSFAVRPELEIDDEEAGSPDGPVVVDGMRQIRIFHNKADGVTIEARGLEPQDYEVIAIRCEEICRVVRGLNDLMAAGEPVVLNETGDSE